jgi:hypothetical protein
VPFEVVYYHPQGSETMKRLPGEFHQALQRLAEREKPESPASLLDLRSRLSAKPAKT